MMKEVDFVLMPYLNFDGNCEEAFLWYAKIFGGEIQQISKYGDIPENPAAPMNAEQKSKVMHAQIMLDEIGVMSGADAIWPIEKGSTVSIQAHLQNEAVAQKVFTALLEGGALLGAMATNPPPDDNGVSGSVKDKYGFTWIISAMKSI